MKKLFILGSFVAFFLASCGGADNSGEAIEKASNTQECDAFDLTSAANCLCDLYNQLEDSDHLSDEEYDALSDRINEFNDAVDLALDEEAYTYDQLMAEGDKIDCKVY